MGYVRNGTLLPWDDDLDLGMDSSKYYEVINEVKKSTNYSTYLHAGFTKFVIKLDSFKMPLGL